MSTTSATTQSHAAQTTAARAQAANPRKPGASGHGPETGADLFAAMLSLLSATTDIPPDTALTTDAASGEAGNPMLTTTDTPADPLAGLLGWPGAPLHPAALGGGHSPAGASTADHTTPTLSDLSASADGAAPPMGTPLAPPGAAPAATDPLGATKPGLDLQGMQRLDRPTAPDEQTLAALARSNGTALAGADGDARATPAVGAAPTLAAPSETASATRTTAWRSTVTSATTASVQQQHATQSLNHSLRERLQVRLDAGSPVALRSTVTLDERFNPTAAGDSPTLSTGPVAHSQASASGSGSFAGEQPGGGDAGHEQPSALQADNEAPDESTRFEETLTEHDTDEGLGAWSSPTLRQASLRVGDGGEEAIDIQLSMTGQELNVAFRTDNAEARAELRENAGESLSDLLQRSGIQLGDVSVGSQDQQHGRGEHGEPRPHAAGNVRNGSGNGSTTAAPAPAAVPPRPRSDGSQPLDLFV